MIPVGDAMEMQLFTLRKDLNINALYCVHYFELARDAAFPMETHDFWELVYIDRGEIFVTEEQEEFTAVSGDLIFHAPGKAHSLRGNGMDAANVMVLNFPCHSRHMEHFVGQRRRPNPAQRLLLKDILKECRAAFGSRLDNPYNNVLQRAKDAPIGSEQMISLYMTELLVSSLRQILRPNSVDKSVGSVPMLDAMISYMEQNLAAKLSLDMLADAFHVSPSYVKRLFSQYKQTGAMHYFTTLKIEYAKKMLREKERNVSQIAEALGYDNSHYFCNQFKQYTGMSPLEYRNSITAVGYGKKPPRP